MMIFHEVDDVNAWLASPKRVEFFGPLGISTRTFVDPNGSNRVGLIVDVDNMETFDNAMASEGAAEAMKVDGVRPETISIFVEG